MSNYELPTGDGWGSASNANSASIPLYPGEKPTYRELQKWSISAKNILNRTIFGPALRGETPPQLMALTGKRDVGITVLSTEQREKCSPLDIARYDQMVAKAKMDEDVRLKHDGRISSRLSRSSFYRPAAPPLAIAVPTSGSYWLYIGSGPRRDGDLCLLYTSPSPRDGW